MKRAIGWIGAAVASLALAGTALASRIDQSGATAEITGPTTMTVTGVTVAGQPRPKYLNLRWNPRRNVYEVVASGDVAADAPHPTGREWLDRSSATFHGASDLDCASCHDLGTDCYRCHFGPTGAKSPDGSGWIHGTVTGHRRFQGSQAVCNDCHALDRSYGYGPRPCHDCHDD